MQWSYRLCCVAVVCTALLGPLCLTVPLAALAPVPSLPDRNMPMYVRHSVNPNPTTHPPRGGAEWFSWVLGNWETLLPMALLQHLS